MSQSNDGQNVSAALSGIDRVIHEPARLSILAVLRAFESTESKLESAGYVDIAKEFVEKVPRTLIRLTDAGRKAVATYRTEMDRILASL